MGNKPAVSLHVCVLMLVVTVLDLSEPRGPLCWIRCGVLCHTVAAVTGVPGHQSDRSQNQAEPSSAKGTTHLCL